MEEKIADVGVVVGRFQVDEPHEGHMKLLNTADKHPRLIIAIGLSHGKCTLDNPLDFQARRVMLQEKFPDATIFYIKDVHDDDLWSQDLDERVLDIVGPGQSIMMYGSRDSFLKSYSGQFPTTEVEPDVIISGTEIRKRLGTAVTNSRDWRGGACWAMANQWPSPMFTIDVAIMNDSCSKILLGRKKREDKFRFVGGFVGNGESLEQAVAREAKEETDVTLKEISYITSCPIDDWRYRSERNKITTTFFIAKVAEGTPVAGDDIHEVKWFDINELKRDDLVSNHGILLEHLVNFLVFH